MLAVLNHFAQDYSYYTVSAPSVSSSSSGWKGLLVGIVVACLVVIAIMIIAMWRVFTKAGKPGWAAIIPIYNTLVLLEVVGRPWWWIFLFLLGVIPFVGAVAALVITIIVYNDLAKSFGKSSGFTVLLVLLPFIGFPVLAFGGAKYKGPAALSSGSAAGGAHPGA